MTKELTKFSVLIIALSCLICNTSIAQQAVRPHILIILADDLGHGDLSYTGGKTPTPNIDKIFNQGI